MREARGLSERRACRLAGMARSSCRYAVRRQEPAGLRDRLRELAQERRRFGYRRLTVLLRREGWAVNHKRVYRLYREEGLAVRRRKRKRIGAVERQPLVIPTRPNERWSMDFISDALSEGRIRFDPRQFAAAVSDSTALCCGDIQSLRVTTQPAQ